MQNKIVRVFRVVVCEYSRASILIIAVYKRWNHLVQHKRQHRTKVLLKSFHLNWSDIRIASIDSKGSSTLHNIINSTGSKVLLIAFI